MAQDTVSRAMQNGELVQKTTDAFRARDITNSGALEWNTGEVRAFIIDGFQALGLSAPPERNIFAMYCKFDADWNSKLDLQECIRLVESLCREAYGIDETTVSNGMPPVEQWATELSLPLTPETDQTRLIGIARRLDRCVTTKLRTAVEMLNKGSIECPEDFCTVYSESARTTFLLYRRGKANEAYTFLGRASNFDPQQAVARAWQMAHAKMDDPQARVPREGFVDLCMLRAPPETSKKESYIKFLNALFDTGTALMLPSQKTDLGKHCFGYAALLANEFYFAEPMDYLCLAEEPKSPDNLVAVRTDLNADWAQVTKDAEGRVSLESFKTHYLQKFADRLVPESQKSYEAFLEQNFQAALSMMLPAEKDSLGGHCFRYAGLMAGEFYFDAAKDAVTGCGCSTPVSDVLGVTKS